MAPAGATAAIASRVAPTRATIRFPMDPPVIEARLAKVAHDRAHPAAVVLQSGDHQRACARSGAREHHSSWRQLEPLRPQSLATAGTMDDMTDLADGVQISRLTEHADEILTPDAVRFAADLHRRFNPRRLELLAARTVRQARFDAGELPDFRPETASVREDDSWVVAAA